MEMSRRRFLGSSAAAVMTAGVMGRGTVFGANDRIRIACVGINGRGEAHIGGFSDQPGSEVVALCDVDRKVLEGRAAALEAKTGKKPKTFVDMRDLFADDGIDAVTFATPNHWHSLGAIWACQAGKDVYVEKPMSHNVFEGRQLVEIAKQSGRVVMVGTQRRTEKDWNRAIQRLHEGVIGDLYMARALCFKNRDSIGVQPDGTPPDTLDWNLWQGPAEERAYNPNYVHYNWHWFWAYGNGDIGNQGVHQMDVALWGLDRQWPVRVGCMGGRFTYEDQGETPNTQVATFQYDDGTMLVFEVRGRATNDEMGARVGNLFYGSGGYMADMRFFDKDNKEIPDTEAKEIDLEDSHWAQFVKAVRSRKPEDNTAPPESGHRSAAHCHLANVAYRVGSQLQFDGATEQFTGANAGDANALLSRDYRAGFEVKKVS